MHMDGQEGVLNSIVVFQGKKGESGLPGVDGLPGPPVRTFSVS